MGDSITRGTFVWRRKRNSYPAQLQALLGQGYRVSNFGVNGHAAQRAADRPYRASKAFTLSLESAPHIVLIMLGTNDSRGQNWRGIEPFVNDYRTLVTRYLSLECVPRVWLLTPPSLFRVRRNRDVMYGMNEPAVRQMCGAVRGLAVELGCELIDIHEVTRHHPEAFKFDGVHPGAKGAALIADAVYAALGQAARTGTASGEAAL